MKGITNRFGLLALALIVVVATAGFATGEEPPADERMEITLGSIAIGAAFPDGVEDPMRDFVEDKFNVTLVPQDYNWGDMETKISTWAAAQTLPDVFFMAQIGSGRYFQWIEDGVIRALPDDLSAWPDLEWTVNNTGVRAYDVDGTTYALPRGGQQVFPSDRQWLAEANLSWLGREWFVRKDWMETLGIDDPQTADEFIDMAVRFVTDDPDGNGVDDTMGLSVGAIWQLHSQSFAYGYTDPSWIKVGDEYHLGITTRDAFELFSFLRELYQKGGLDPDFILNAGGFDPLDRFATDKVGITGFQSHPVHFTGIKQRWEQFNSERPFFDHVKVLRPFLVPGKDLYAIGRPGVGFWSESYIAGTVDDEKMNRILDLYDWMYSEEGILTTMFGFEGEDYRMVGGAVEPLKTDADGNVQYAGDLYPIMSGSAGFQYQVMWPADAVQWVHPDYAATHAAAAAEVEWFQSVGGKEAPVIAEVQAIDVPEKQNLAIDPPADWANFIIDDSGKSNEQLYQEMIDNWDANGYADAVRAIKAAAKDMGY